MRLFSELLQTHPVAHMESGPLWSFTHITVAITLCVCVCVCVFTSDNYKTECCVQHYI